MGYAQYVRAGLGWFLGTAVFFGCWAVFMLMIGLMARILGGADDEDGEDEEDSEERW